MCASVDGEHRSSAQSWKAMNHQETLDKLLKEGIVAVIRMADRGKVVRVAKAIADGGVKCLEVTMTVPGAIEVIAELTSAVTSDILVGAGTVLDEQKAAQVIRAGAKFVVSPIFNPGVLEMCKKNGTVCIPGCFSPTEIYTAWAAGADIIKVFPARNLTPKFFKDIAGPFPQIKLMPTGGVTIENAGEWRAAGAVAIGIGTELLDKKAIEEERYSELTDRAKRLVRNFSGNS